jgi:hypothetical protein
MLKTVRVPLLVVVASALCASLAPASAVARVAVHGDHVPLFARQTNRMCSACHMHSHYSELTEMGRTFKLNGYRLSKIDSLLGSIEENSMGGRSQLLLNLVNSLGFMVQSSYTLTDRPQPGTQNGTAELPDQLSLFLGGRISPNTGGFIQLTYSGSDGSFGIDNVDLRFADSVRLFSKTTVVGLSLNNNPSVQDLWNTTPAWRFPWASSSVAPAPAAAALIDGTLGQQVLGLSALAMWNERVYGEFGVYRTAVIGQGGPLDSTAEGAISGVAPYWRLAFPRAWGNNYLMVGTYGMSGRLYPTGVTGATNRFTDVAFDVMDQVKLGLRGVSFHGTWIHETQRWGAGGADNLKNTLDTYRVDGQFHFGHMFCFMLSPFATTGSTDAGLYQPEPLTGSRTGSPDSNGLIGELDVNVWDNVRVQFQYTAYGKFNGSSQNYDGSGRSAADNNTLYVVTWLVF